MSKKMVGCVCTVCNVPFRDEIETEQPPDVHSLSSFADLNTRIYKLKCFDCLTKRLAACFGEWLGRFASQRKQQTLEKREVRRALKKHRGKQPLTVAECFSVLDRMDAELLKKKGVIDDKLRELAETVDAAG